MPNYSYTCTVCNREWESVHTVDARNTERCCSKKANLLITTVSKSVVNEGYNIGLGCNITGPAHKRRIMKEKGLSELD